MRFLSILILAAVFSLIGCSGGSNPASPEAIPDKAKNTDSSHMTWGMWQFRFDPIDGKLDIVRLRSTEMHLNTLIFLEPPPFLNLTLESPLKFTGNVLDVDIGLRHPFLGLDEFTGFDVCGIFISKGNMAGFSDASLRMAGQGDTRLLNADGFTRWWNPTEFPYDNTMFSYKDGLLGTPDSTGGYNATLNGYKSFCDELTDPDMPVSNLSPSSRCVFSAGKKNIRHYTIELGPGLVFNYAVDASWQFPTGPKPWDVPDDFPPAANRPEAWNATVTEVENTLYNDGTNIGGDLKLSIDLWDHYNAGQNKIYAESPGNFDKAGPITPTGGGVGYSTYEVDITSATPAEGSIDILVYAESEVSGYQGKLPGKLETAYFMYNAKVNNVANLGPTAIMEATTPTTINLGDSVSFDASASTGAPPLAFTWDFNGDGIYGGTGDDYTGSTDKPTHQFNNQGTFNVTVKVSNTYGEDISDAVPVKVGLDLTDIYVDADYTGGSSDGSPDKPFLTVQDGMNAVTAGHKVHVDYFDGEGNTYDTDGLTLKSNVVLIGDNWNGGGPDKPKLKNNNGYYTIGTGYSSVSDFTLEGFEIGVGEAAGNSSNYGINFPGYGGINNNITVRHCRITGSIEDTGKSGGAGVPIWAGNCDNSLFEYNDIGPMTWHSDTPGEYARVLWGMYFDGCDNTEVKNNFIHDITMDYDGQLGLPNQIRMFLLHCYNCTNIDVHNNLICHIKGINDYDYRIEGMMMEGYNETDHDYHYYNNTVDNLDHSQSNGGFMLRGVFIYNTNAANTDLNNMLLSDFYSGGGAGVQAYYASYPDIYGVSYSTGHNLDGTTDYFYNFIEGDGVTEYPGIDPQYENNTTPPYDYHFKTGSGCEMGDPNFIDWDDTGSPSGDPDEPDIQNRSRLGCFGGPDGNWDPNDL